MGKYMKKPKISGEVSVIEVVGVRTRAKTLALKQLQSQSQSPEDLASLSYLQLRSRRLHKPAPVANCRGDHDRCRRGISVETEEDVDASCGENYLESDVRDRRTTRESTPRSLIRTPSNIVTPGSTTRRRSSATTDRRNQTGMQMNNPLTHEVEEFFAAAEQQQQRQFMEKYNFDIVNDLPLPGCYEWVQIF